MSEAPHWFKSSYSSFEDACVEVAFGVPAGVMVRDTQNRSAVVLAVGSREWSALVTSAARV
ncbi:DUF397 domain-containing protein [Nocardiopsis changdeensis]|uniref:DUF397 domain-containing protein n=1 Tax=Nocardiopsis changdeensis TaxID=2831969 RepID=A0ABX8BRD4_9ACTN|nr:MULTISPECIES: DUF397 domain-containing protein [Nocardiopsis]QUX23834.1 DUF397 domain-containing protein [Nocardiopsis changdeensis]QYX39779.1 DUF397 domain-containing protein [Nocardiopsis sp. MT53]